MKKRTAIICLCTGGCLLVGIVIGAMFQGKTYRQPDSARELTEAEKEEAIKIALSNASVKDILKGKEYKVGEVRMGKVGSFEKGWKESPSVRIYIDERRYFYAVVDLENKKVITMYGPPFRETMPREVTEEEREEAIKIALSNKSVREKIGGLDYEIVDVRGLKRWVSGEKLETYFVGIGIKGTTIAYNIKVNLTEGKVTYISQSHYEDKIGREKTSKAVTIALNDSRIKEKIEGKGYEIGTCQRLIGERLVVDVEIILMEPKYHTIAVVRVDPEEEKIIKIDESGRRLMPF